jgi:hypothetical protein
MVSVHEQRLNSLFKQKLEIQNLEKDQQKDRKEWQTLGTKIHKRGQEIHKKIETLLNSI